MLDGKPVLIAAQLADQAERDPRRPAWKAEELREIGASLAKLSEADRKLAESKACASYGRQSARFDGGAGQLMVDGKPVFICCEGCRKEAREASGNAIEKAAQLNERSNS